MSDLSKPGRIEIPAALVMPGDEVITAVGRIRRVLSKEFLGEVGQTVRLELNEGVSLQVPRSNLITVIPR